MRMSRCILLAILSLAVRLSGGGGGANQICALRCSTPIQYACAHAIRVAGPLGAEKIGIQDKMLVFGQPVSNKTISLAELAAHTAFYKLGPVLLRSLVMTY